MDQMFQQISWLPVLVASLAAMVVGMVWYSPFAFGNVWMRLSGIDPGKKKENMKKEMVKAMVGSFISTVITAVILQMLFVQSQINTIEGAVLGVFWIWLGFVATIKLTHHLFEGKPFPLYLLNAFYDLVVLLVMGTIVALWQ